MSGAARAYLAFVAAGFRRYATYRQALIAAVVTNCTFGFIRCALLLTIVHARDGGVAGYDDARLATFVWVGQGLIGLVFIWAPPELAERIRSGNVVMDLLRPVDPVWRELAADLGRAGYAALTRLVVPIAVGALFFDLYAPHRLSTYAAFAVSVLMAAVVSFACRYVVNAAAYWLLDARGPQMAWILMSGVLGGLYFPLWFLPDAAAWAIVAATPFPSVIQIPLDVLVERGGPGQQAALLTIQAAWTGLTLAVCQWVQRRAERKLVIQGG
jgi:ABC-2 type transport system permease protein